MLLKLVGWQAPCFVEPELRLLYSDVYMDSDLSSEKDIALSVESYRMRHPATMTVRRFTNNFGGVRLDNENNATVEYYLSVEQGRALGETKVTIGELSFVIARGHQVIPVLDSESLGEIPVIRAVVGDHEAIGWSILLDEMGVAVRDVVPAYTRIKSLGLSFDQAASYFMAGLKSVQSIDDAVSNSVDLDIIRSLAEV